MKDAECQLNLQIFMVINTFQNQIQKEIKLEKEELPTWHSYQMTMIQLKRYLWNGIILVIVILQCKYYVNLYIITPQFKNLTQETTNFNHLKLSTFLNQLDQISHQNDWIQDGMNQVDKEPSGLGKLLAGAEQKDGEIPYEILQKEKDYAEDIKAKYEAQVIAHTRTEKRVKELEKTLEQERKKLKSTNTELVRSLEDEKIARKTIETQLSKLKEDFAQKELEKDKIISDLSIKLDKIKIEKSQYELELNKVKDAQLRTEQMYVEKINTLEEQINRSQNLYVELDESTRYQITKLNKENNEISQNIQRKYEQTIKQKDESLRETMNEVETLRQQVSQLKSELLERKAEEEARLNEKLKEINQFQKQFHDAMVQEQEQKGRMGNQQQERFAKFQEDLKNELDKVYYQHQKEMEQMELKVNRLRDEKAAEMKQVSKSQQQKNQIEQQLKLSQSEVERANHEKHELQSKLNFLQEQDSNLKENIEKEFNIEVLNLKNQNRSLLQRCEELENALNASRKQNANIKQDFERFNEIINQKVQESLDQAFLQSQESSIGLQENLKMQARPRSGKKT